MLIFNPFDIVKVPFPFTDRQTTKRRPALVISQAKYQQLHRHLILIMITSAKHSNWPDDINIINYEATGLPSPSIIRFKLFTLDDRFVLGQIGILEENDQLRVKNNLKKYVVLK